MTKSTVEQDRAIFRKMARASIRIVSDLMVLFAH